MSSLYPYDQGTSCVSVPLWQVEVQLNGAALPLASNGILNLHIDLGTVEGTT
jgi:hypothetical protein